MEELCKQKKLKKVKFKDVGYNNPNDIDKEPKSQD
jgi:hypothetical protein